MRHPKPSYHILKVKIKVSNDNNKGGWYRRSFLPSTEVKVENHIKKFPLNKNQKFTKNGNRQRFAIRVHAREFQSNSKPIRDKKNPLRIIQLKQIRGALHSSMPKVIKVLLSEENLKILLLKLFLRRRVPRNNFIVVQGINNNLTNKTSMLKWFRLHFYNCFPAKNQKRENWRRKILGNEKKAKWWWWKCFYGGKNFTVSGGRQTDANIRILWYFLRSRKSTLQFLRFAIFLLFFLTALHSQMVFSLSPLERFFFRSYRFGGCFYRRLFSSSLQGNFLSCRLLL